MEIKLRIELSEILKNLKEIDEILIAIKEGNFSRDKVSPVILSVIRKIEENFQIIFKIKWKNIFLPFEETELIVRENREQFRK